jgi:hypothetical protein
MAWDDSGSRSFVLDLSPTFRATLTYDSGRSAVQPYSPHCISTTCTYSPPITLFELWIRGWHEPDEKRPNTLDAIMKHAEFRQILAKAIGKRGFGLRDSDRLRNLRDSVKARFTIRYLERTLKYRNQGAVKFTRWLRKVLKSAVKHVRREMRPGGGKRIHVVDHERRARKVAARSDLGRREELLDAIQVVKKPKHRMILVDRLDGKTIQESAKEHGLSPSYVGTLRKRGVAELRRIMRGD